MRPLAKDTILGFLLGISLFAYAIYRKTTNYLMFLDVSSLLLVLGGTIAATMVSYRGGYVIKALKSMLSILIPQEISSRSLYDEVARIIKWGRIIRQKGLIGLEKDIARERINDPLINYGAELLITGYEGDQLRTMLLNYCETSHERGMVQSNILRSMANYAPAFGMVGTLFGLIIMFDNLDGDPSNIGSGMSVALITTLYGVLLAQFLFRPSAEKVKQKLSILRFRNLLVTEGLIMLAEKRDSIEVQDMLNSFLDPKYHFNIVTRKD